MGSKLKGTQNTNCPYPAVCGAGKGDIFPLQGHRGRLSPQRSCCSSQVSLDREDSAPLSQGPHVHSGTPRTSIALQTRKRQKDIHYLQHVTLHRRQRGTEPTSPGGFKLRPGAMKHPGECVQLAIRLPERERECAQLESIRWRSSREDLVQLHLGVCTAKLVVTHQKSNPWGNCH